MRAPGGSGVRDFLQDDIVNPRWAPISAECTNSFTERFGQASFENLSYFLRRIARRKVRKDDVLLREKLVALEHLVEVDVSHLARVVHRDAGVQKAGFEDQRGDRGELGHSFEDFHAGVARKRKDRHVVRLVDGDALRYFAIWGGGPITEWTARMNAFVSTIQAATPNFRSFIAPGTYHCILPYANFYDVESSGVKVVDWISQVVADQPVSNVTCGDQCDALAPGSGR
jgi:hypothetical protein